MKHLERMGNRMLWTAIIMTLVCGVYAVWNTAKAQSGIIQDGKITGQSFLTRCDSVFDRPPGELNKLETHFAGICYGVLYGLNGSAAHMPAWIAGRHTKIRKLTAEDIEPYRAYCAPNEMQPIGRRAPHNRIAPLRTTQKRPQPLCELNGPVECPRHDHIERHQRAIGQQADPQHHRRPADDPPRQPGAVPAA